MSGFDKPSAEHLGTSPSLAAEYLRQGKIVAFPTETYYGLAVDPENDRAVASLYKLKQRTGDKPLLLLVEHIRQLGQLVAAIPAEYHKLMASYWPGPLTLVFPAAASLNSRITARSGTVGIRISPHPTAIALLQALGQPITATSANISGMEPAKSAAEVQAMFGDGVDYILDGGITDAGLCSTIVAMVAGRLAILRRGRVDLGGEVFL